MSKPYHMAGNCGKHRRRTSLDWESACPVEKTAGGHNTLTLRGLQSLSRSDPARDAAGAAGGRHGIVAYPTHYSALRFTPAAITRSSLRESPSPSTAWPNRPPSSTPSAVKLESKPNRRKNLPFLAGFRGFGSRGQAAPAIMMAGAEKKK